MRHNINRAGNGAKRRRTQVSRPTAIAYILAALILTLDLLGIIPGAVAMSTAVTGTMVSAGREDDGPDTHRVPSVTEVITRIEPSKFPFDTFLTRLNRSAPTKQVVHRWPELSRYPRAVTVNGATTAGSANASMAVTVDDNFLIKAGDILIAPANATNATFKYYVSAVTSTTGITVYALPQDTAGTAPYTSVNYGTVPAFADNEVLYWIANAKSEADDASAARAMQPAYKFNYVQTFDMTVKVSDHKMRSQNFGEQDWIRYRRDNLFEFRKNNDYGSLFSTEASVTADPGDSELIWTMAGLKGFVGETVTLQHTSGVPTESQVVDLIYSCFDDNNGSERKILMGGSGYLKSIDKVNTGDLFTRRTEKMAGVTVNTLESRIGRLDTVYHPGFDELGYTNEGVVIDFDHVVKRVYQETEKRKIELKTTGNATDAEGEYYITKWTLEVRNPDAHKWLNKA